MTKFDKPPLQSTNAGVLFIRPADILLSEAGQKELSRAEEAVAQMQITKPQPDTYRQR